MSEDDDAASDSEPSPAPAQTPKRTGLLIALAITAADALVISFAFNPVRAGTIGVIASMGALYAVCAAFALLRLRKRGELDFVMRPKRGDLSLGFVVALLLYGGAMAVNLVVAARNTPHAWWIARMYIQIGDPDTVNMHLVGASVFVVAILEEITWRGLVMRSLESFGPLTAWLASTVLFGVAHLPTVWLLAEPKAGPNPLVVAAAIGCGFVWGYLAQRTNRLGLALFAHAFFSWGIVEFPLWRPFG